MRSKSTIFVISIIFTCSFISCTKNATYVTPPEFKQKLVVNAYLSPDKADNEIFVTSNEKRFGEISGEPEPFGNVSLILYENSQEIQLDTIQQIVKRDYYPGYNFIIKNFRFKESHTYNLKVISDPGLQAEATCKIPIKRDFQITVDTSFIKTTDKYGMSVSILNAKISITDFPGEANYYRLLYLYEAYRPGFPHTKNISIKDVVEPVIPGVAEYNPWQNDHVSNDAGRDGKKFIIRSIEFQPVHLDFESSSPDSAFLRIYLLSTDKPYYDFHKSAENFSLGDGPFTEPTLLYSNVSGGLGIFASYTLDSLIYRIK